MPTTSNFGWTTPADTDLVKDGAAAIRTLGNGIDTSLVDLKGGTTGQILSKNSNTDLDYTWINNDQGDITEVQAGTGISVASGTGPVPVVTNTVATTFDAKGDLVVGTGADTFAKLTVGTNGHTLVADSSTSTGLAWAAAASGGMTLIETLSPSGVASVTSSTIAGTYKHILLVVKGVYGSTNNDFYLRMNGDSGGNYTYSRINITATPAFSGTVTSASNEIRLSDIANVTGYNQVVSGYFWIYRYPDTDHTFGNGGFIAEDGVRKATYINGLYNNSAAITTVTLGMLSGTMTDGDIWIYGVN